MEYVIEWCEKKTTSTGKEKLNATLSKDGVAENDVTIWADFPDFINIASGRKVTGNIVSKQNGQYLNKTLYPITTPASANRPAGGGFAAGAMQKKAENISHAQDRKEEGIMISSSARMATDFVTAFYPEIANYEDREKSMALEEKWKEWRKFFIENWEVSIDPTSRKPF